MTADQAREAECSTCGAKSAARCVFEGVERDETHFARFRRRKSTPEPIGVCIGCAVPILEETPHGYSEDGVLLCLPCGLRLEDEAMDEPNQDLIDTDIDIAAPTDGRCSAEMLDVICGTPPDIENADPGDEATEMRVGPPAVIAPPVVDPETIAQVLRCREAHEAKVARANAPRRPAQTIGQKLGVSVRNGLRDLLASNDQAILDFVGALEEEIELAATSTGLESFERLAKAALSLARNSGDGSAHGWAQFRVLVLASVDCYRMGFAMAGSLDRSDLWDETP